MSTEPLPMAEEASPVIVKSGEELKVPALHVDMAASATVVLSDYMPGSLEFHARPSGIISRSFYGSLTYLHDNLIVLSPTPIAILEKNLHDDRILTDAQVAKTTRAFNGMYGLKTLFYEEKLIDPDDITHGLVGAQFSGLYRNIIDFPGQRGAATESESAYYRTLMVGPLFFNNKLDPSFQSLLDKYNGTADAAPLRPSSDTLDYKDWWMGLMMITGIGPWFKPELNPPGGTTKSIVDLMGLHSNAINMVQPVLAQPSKLVCEEDQASLACAMSLEGR